MQIIPVIDVLEGRVVRAVAGNRSEYLPIKSILTSKITPKGVIQDLLTFFNFKTIYIAELDSIQHGRLDVEFYQSLFEQFPKVTFWFDYGVSRANDTKAFQHLENVAVVVGTETLVDPDALAEGETVLSLDYRQGVPLGLEQLHNEAESWPTNVIVMSLDQVGMQSGPNYALIDTLSAKNKTSDYFAAGGVRDEQDLATLAKKGIKGVLVASALHNGKIDRETLKRFE